MSHTPGPWNWEGDPVKGDPFGRVRYQVTTTGKTIARVYYSSFEGGPTNAEYDARLIAAAPELLKALKVMLRDMQAVNAGGQYGIELEPALYQAHKAISKAEGG